MRTILCFLTILCLACSAFGQQKRVNGVEVVSAVNGTSSNQVLRGFHVANPAGTSFQSWWVTANSHILVSNDVSGQLWWDIDQDNNDVFYALEFLPNAANLPIGRSTFPWDSGWFTSSLNVRGETAKLVFGEAGNGSTVVTNNNTTTNFNIRPTSVAPGGGLTVGPGGNVGFGTSAPAASVHVVGGTMVFQKVGTPARVGGTFHVTTTPVFNAGSSTTNLYTNYIPAHTLTNNGDTVTLDLAGMTISGSPLTNSFSFTYGNDTLFLNVNGLISNTVYTARVNITRTGNTSQVATFGLMLNGVPLGAGWAVTNNVRITSQTNGIDTRLIWMVASTLNGGVTNVLGRLAYYPAP